MKNTRRSIVICTLGIYFALLLSVNILKAQNITTTQEVRVADPSLNRVELGFRFMPTISSFDMRASDGGIVEGKTVVGYGIGGLFGINFSRNIGMQAEVIYNSVSQKFKDQELERIITVNYINIPLLLALNTNKAKCVNLNMVIGPQIGLNVGSRFETSGGSESDTLTTILAVRQGDLGFAYGAGLEFALNSMQTVRLGLGFRGVYGLIDISNNNSQNTTARSYYLLDRTKIKTYSAYLGISFLF